MLRRQAEHPGISFCWSQWGKLREDPANQFVLGETRTNKLGLFSKIIKFTIAMIQLPTKQFVNMAPSYQTLASYQPIASYQIIASYQTISTYQTIASYQTISSYQTHQEKDTRDLGAHQSTFHVNFVMYWVCKIFQFRASSKK